MLVALGSTSFDGLTRTRIWLDLTSDLSGNAATLAKTAGLVWAIGIVAIAYAVAMRVGARLVADRLNAEELRAAFVHSLVPIALAYAVAHYSPTSSWRARSASPGSVTRLAGAGTCSAPRPASWTTPSFHR